jgi:cell wall-associated NlpC family hydrolase
MPKFCKVAAALVLAFSLLISTASAEFAAIGRTTENLRLRAEPSLTARILITAPRGSSVTVTQEVPLVNQDGAWYAVVYNGTAGFMSADFLSVDANGDGISEVGFINEASVNFRALPSTGSDRIRTLTRNTQVEITGVRDGWYAVRHDGTEGFVRADLITLGTPPAAAARTVSNNSASHARALSTLDSEGVTELRRQIVEESLKYLGTPYRHGQTGPNSFDCSGFTVYIFRKFDIRINRSSADQYRNTGTSITKGELLPGDLVYFRTTSRNAVTHVGIYIGGGQFIHSSSGRARCVVIDSINTGFYNERYVGAKRVLP